jgi:hypothetical protein
LATRGRRLRTTLSGDDRGSAAAIHLVAGVIAPIVLLVIGRRRFTAGPLGGRGVDVNIDVPMVEQPTLPPPARPPPTTKPSHRPSSRARPR